MSFRFIDDGDVKSEKSLTVNICIFDISYVLMDVFKRTFRNDALSVAHCPCDS